MAGVLGVDPVPAFGDGPVGEIIKPADFAQHQFVDLRLVEDLDVFSVFVRIAEDDRTEAVLRGHDVDPEAVELRRFAGDPLFHRTERRADLEVRVVAQGQPAGEHRPELPAVRLRHGAHHLELAGLHRRRGEDFGEERFEVVAGADEDLIERVLVATAGPQGSAADLGDGGAPVEADTVFLRQESRQRGQHLARVDIDLGRAEKCGLGHAAPDPRTTLLRGRAGPQFAGIAEVAAETHELLQHRCLVIAVDHMDRAGGPRVDAGGRDQFEPQLAAAQRHRIELRRLAERPEHSEVPHRRAARLVAALEHRHLAAGPRRGPGMGHAHDPAAHDSDLVFFHAHDVSQTVIFIVLRASRDFLVRWPPRC